ncbi:hypothetical protein [Pseudoduganella aquatica]|uniref:hypothetical protein n=1 Tax=Pseudoduganella aquatica TaxID=2660641 RepID=UPI001E5316C6|nr:hypothetical protein [Pseudoduganella aquatica]
MSNPITHTFVAITGSDGAIDLTYSWGNDANLRGWNLNQPLELKTAQQALKDGLAQKVGNATLDPFVRLAFDTMNNARNKHSNGIVTNNCKSEVAKLLDLENRLRVKIPE